MRVQEKFGLRLILQESLGYKWHHKVVPPGGKGSDLISISYNFQAGFEERA